MRVKKHTQLFCVLKKYFLEIEINFNVFYIRMSERPKYIPPTIFDICESSDVLNYMGYHEYFDLVYKQDRNLMKYNGDTPLIVLMDSEFYKKFEYLYSEKDEEARKLKLRLVPYLVKRSGVSCQS